jgi:hypothetical protein
VKLLKIETRIRERDNKLIIILSDLVVKKGKLKSGDVLKIQLQNTEMTITNKPKESASLEKVANEEAEDIFSKTLREEELILAK